MKGCGYDGCTDAAAFRKYDIGLCYLHSTIVHNTVRTELYSHRIRRLFDTGVLTTHSPGITYITQLPNLNIKIGYTKDGRTLYNRLVSFGKQFRGKPELLATVDGGETMEACLHSRFSEYRRYELFNEQFRPVADIFYFAKETGLESEGQWAKEAFESWEYEPGKPVQPSSEEHTFLLVPCPYCGADVNEPCSWITEGSETIHSARRNRFEYLSGMG